MALGTKSRLAVCTLVWILAVLAAGPASGQSPPGASTATTKAATTPDIALPDLLPARPDYGTVFDAVELRDLPSARNLWSLVETADAMVIADRLQNGGLYLGEMPRLGSYGSSWTQTSFVLDGIDVTDPLRTGMPMLYLDPQVLQRITVPSALLPVDVTGSGPVVRLTPRGPGERWHATLQVSGLPSGLQADASSGLAPPIARFGSSTDGSLLIAGPLAPGRVGLLVSGRLATSRRFEGDDPTALDSRLASFFAHAVVTPSPSSQLRILGSVDTARHPFDGRARFADRSVSGNDTFLHAHATWERLVSARWAWSAVGGYQQARLSGPDQPSVGTVERLVDGPVDALMAPAAATRDRLDGIVRVAWMSGGRRQARVTGGLSIGRVSATTSTIPPAEIGETVDGIPARVWLFSFAGPTSQRETELAGWVDASLALTPRLLLNAAARLDSTHGASNGGASVGWTTLMPRVAVRWNLTAGGGLTALAAYEAHRSRLPLDYLAYAGSGGLSGQVFRWNDLNHDGRVQPGELGPLVSVVGPGGATSAIDPQLKAPFEDEIVLSLQARLGSRWRFRLSAVDRRLKDAVAPVNVGVPVSDYSVIQVLDPGEDFSNPADDRLLTIYNRNPDSFGQDRYLLTNPAGAGGTFQGVDLALERVIGGRWHMLFGGSTHQSDGAAGNPGFRVTENDMGVLGAAYLDPNALTYNRGRLFFDRAYVIKWSVGGVLPHDVVVGTVARYQDGQPFARMVIAPNLNQGAEAIQAYTDGYSRFTYTFTLDARVEKGFRLGSRRAAAVLEAFNLLNTANEVEEVVVTTHGTFRTPTLGTAAARRACRRASGFLTADSAGRACPDGAAQHRPCRASPRASGHTAVLSTLSVRAPSRSRLASERA